MKFHLERYFQKHHTKKRKQNRTTIFTAMSLSCMWVKLFLFYLFHHLNVHCYSKPSILLQLYSYFTFQNSHSKCPITKAVKENSAFSILAKLCICIAQLYAQILFTCARLKLIKLVFHKHSVQVGIK